MDPVRYRILGTTQALRPDGTAVPVGGARLRALLTVLALRAGRAVPVALLVEEVWDGDPPADAPGALQALVGRLRRTLGADAVESVDGGYRLGAGPDDIDLHRFTRLADDGARALADGDPAKAAALLDDALALWRDPVLADLPDRTTEAARWETLRLDARRTRLDAALALGRAEQALPVTGPPWKSWRTTSWTASRSGSAPAGCGSASYSHTDSPSTTTPIRSP
uniref:AfsR/SARP family transcriptional regulator n=1 Tax=Streptomyces glaucescens TaxID=1907 RepID=UPI001B8089FB